MTELRPNKDALEDQAQVERLLLTLARIAEPLHQGKTYRQWCEWMQNKAKSAIAANNSNTAP